MRDRERERDRERKAMPEGRVPPNALDAERSVLSCCLLDNDCIDVVTEILGVDDFYSESNAIVWETARELWGGGAPVDTVQIRAQLVIHGKLAAAGGDEYLLGLSNTIPNVANVEAHARIVRDLARMRRLILAGHEITAAGYGVVESPETYVAWAESTIHAAVDHGATSTLVHVHDAAGQVLKDTIEAANKGTGLIGYTTGFTRLDALLAGWQGGDLIILASRPGMGKTALAMQFATTVAEHEGLPVPVFSLEMPRRQLVRRMVGQRACVNQHRLRTGGLRNDEWPRFTNACGELAKLPVYVDDTPALTMAKLRSKVRRLRSRSKTKLGLVVVDYLQLMGADRRMDSREQEVAYNSRELKALAKELDVAVIALAQLNREATKRRRPAIDDLRESGAIEADADTVMLIYRDEVYNPRSADVGIGEVIVGKQRSGATGMVRLKFTDEHTRFDNLGEDESPQLGFNDSYAVAGYGGAGEGTRVR